MNFYVVISVSAAVPVLLTALLYYLMKKTALGKLNHWGQQIIYGLIFGVVAILATRFGVPRQGVIINVRDAAPICAGLVFGAPAGIIAGVIGGAERAMEGLLWNIGAYSWIACSVSTMLAGLLAGLARKKMFDDKCPSALFAAAMAVVVEILHMTVLMLTKLGDAERAVGIIKIATIPMILSNATGVFLAVLFARILRGIFRHEDKSESKEPFILETIEFRLLIAIVVAFFLTSTLVFLLQTNTAVTSTEEQLTGQVEDLREDVWRLLDENMLTKARNISYELVVNPDLPLPALASSYGVTDIYMINSAGIVTSSVVAGVENQNVGYDMASNEQSAEFLVLLHGEKTYCQDFGAIGAAEDDEAQNRKFVGVALKDGFIQIGVNQDDYYAVLDEMVKSMGDSRHIGKTGSLLVINGNETVIAGDQKELTARDIHTLALTVQNQTASAVETVNLESGKAYTYVARVEQNVIIAFLPYAEAMDTRDTMIYINACMEVLVFAFLFVLIFEIVSRKVVRKIKDVNEKLSAIIDGDRSVVLRVGGSREMVSLSNDINKTVETLNGYVEMTRKRIEEDLENAKKIQHAALPSVFPAFPDRKEFDIYATMDTAKAVGGDFYDFYLLDDDHLAFLIADVSGKGIPAAMFMMTAKTVIRSLADTGISVEEILTRANEKLCANNEADMFVTAWMAVLNLRTGELHFANAGHNPPLLCHREGRFSDLRSKPKLPLGSMDGMLYRLETLQLQAGDRLFLYTDGVTEATSADVQMYGEDRLLRFLNDHTSETPEETIHLVRASIDAFVGEAEQFDDITMLMLHFGGDGMDRESKVFPANVEEMDNANALVEGVLERNDANMKAQMQIMVAFEEIFVNVCHYAYKGKPGDVQVDVAVGDGMAEITVTDSGVPFNPLGRDDPDITLSAEDREIGGLGIFMVRKTMDEVLYRYEGDKNIFTMKKKI